MSVNYIFIVLQPPPNPNRFAILSTRLLHSNLSVIHYSVFFQMCRAHGIGFDMKVRKSFITWLQRAAVRGYCDTLFSTLFFPALTLLNSSFEKN